MRDEFVLEFYGDYGCFTRPEHKTERFTYDVITPSAAKSLFEGIYWKPEFKWQINKICVLNKIDYTNIRTNEVQNKISTRQFFKKDGGVSVNKDRTQKHSRILKNLRYIITAKIIPKNFTVEEYIKHKEIFLKRVKKQTQYYDLYFGCREFTCHYNYMGLLDEDIPMDTLYNSVYEGYKNKELDLGFSLFGINFHDDDDSVTKPSHMFYKVTMKNGIVYVPNVNNDNEVLKC